MKRAIADTVLKFESIFLLVLNTKQHSYEGSISWFSQSVRVGFLFSIYQLLFFNLIALGVSDKEINPTDLKERATRILNNNCVSCHGLEKQKGDVIS